VRVARRLGALGAAYETLRSTGPRYVARRLLRDALLRRSGASRAQGVYHAIWGEAARELGAEVRELPGGALEIRKGAVVTTVIDHRVPLDAGPASGAGKGAGLEALRDAGLSVPESIEFDATDVQPALDFLARSGSPTVVKPVGSGGGKGITTGIRRRQELERAATRAARFSPRLLIERQADGDAYRFLVLDGELIDVIRRRAPRLSGDGRRSVRRLIAAENRRRQAAAGAAGWAVLKADLDAVLTLERQGLTLASVPSAGHVFQVKTVNNQTRPEDSETVREPIAADLREEVLAAAATSGLRLAGVDVVTRDLGRPLRKSGGVILEVNRDPSPHHHYHVADPAGATRVAVPILRRLLSA